MFFLPNKSNEAGFFILSSRVLVAGTSDADYNTECVKYSPPIVHVPGVAASPGVKHMAGL